MSVTADVVSNMARNAAGELVKGHQPIGKVAQGVASDAVEQIEKRGPGFAKEAGIMTWRYAALGWITWNVGKWVLWGKARQAIANRKKAAEANGR